MIELRPYQSELIQRIREEVEKGTRRILVQGPTGMGKTALTSYMIKGLSENGYRSWFCVHRQELIDQCGISFNQEQINYSIIASGYQSFPSSKTHLCSIQTLVRKHDKFPTPDFIFPDEAHHSVSKSWSTIFNSYPKSKIIGLTATPERLDGKGLRNQFDTLITGPSVKQLIQEGYLSPFTLYIPFTIDMSTTKVSMGDYKINELGQRVDKPKITGDVIEQWKKYAFGKRSLFFCPTIEHANHVAEDFRSHGIQAETLNSHISRDERRAIIKRFVSGETTVLTNVDLVSEGFDLPAIECIGMLRATMSLSVYLQQIGRALRPFQGKEKAIILDFVGNKQRHGKPDMDREWSLDGINRKTGKPNSTVRVKNCPKCFSPQKPGQVACPYCRYKFVVASGLPETQDGELIEDVGDYTPLPLEKTPAYWQLVGVGKKRRVPNPESWARYVLQAKMLKGVR